MKRVTIAIALAMSMLFGSSAFAGSKSYNMQLDANFISVGWNNGHYQRAKQYRRHVQRYRPAPRRHVQRYRPAPRRHVQRYRPAPRRYVQSYRQAPRRHFKRQVPRYNMWHHQKRRMYRKH